MAIERTLVIIKPEVIYYDLTDADKIAKLYESEGLRIVNDFFFVMTKDKAESFYIEHASKVWLFPGLTLAMSSYHSRALILEGEDAIRRVRQLNGHWDGSEIGTIRSEFRRGTGPFNTVHGSDSPGSAAREIALVLSWKPRLS